MFPLSTDDSLQKISQAYSPQATAARAGSEGGEAAKRKW